MELLNELALLAANASEQVHTPENPAYDYVDNSRDSEVRTLRKFPWYLTDYDNRMTMMRTRRQGMKKMTK